MKIGDYRTDGMAVAYRRDYDTLILWMDAESASVEMLATSTVAQDLTRTWRPMTPGEVSLWWWPPSPADSVSARDWMGMWDIARVRADKAEAEVKALRALIAKARAHLHPGIQLSNLSYQEGYRYAAAQVLAILGEP